MELCEWSNRSRFGEQVVRPLLEASLLRMTIPDKPTSSRQKYCTTKAGERLSRDQVGTKSGLSPDQARVLAAAQEPQPLPALMEICGRSNRTKFREQVVRPLLEGSLLRMTIPDKPTSSRQRYSTTEAGQAVLSEP